MCPVEGPEGWAQVEGHGGPKIFEFYNFYVMYRILHEHELHYSES